MTSRKLGKAQVQVSELGFGAAQIGNLHSPVDDATAFAAVEAAWRAGVRYFDTAPHYGLGLSERRLGAALADKPRGAYVVSTKVGRLLVPNPAGRGSDLSEGGFAVPDALMRQLDYSADGARRSLEASLERLGLDHVDVVYVHDPDDPAHLQQAIYEAIPALCKLRDEGVVGAVGAGMNYWQPLLRVVREADVDAVMLAGRWTLLDRSGAPLLEECLQRGVSVVAAAPFNSGLLAYDWPPEGALWDYAPAPPEVLGKARDLARVCRRHGTTLPAAALQFPLRHKAVASVVAGVRTAEQARACAEHFAAIVPEAAWRELEVMAH